MKLQCVVFGLSFFMTSVFIVAQTGSQNELDLGVQAYKQARFEEAIQHFQNVTALQPDNVVARLYLGNAYAAQYIPGINTAENVHMGEAAVSEYQAVLKIEPHSLESLKGVAYLDLQMKNFEDAKTYYRSAIDVDAADAESYFSIAVIDWGQAYSARMTKREKLGLKPEQHLITSGECWDVKSSNENYVKDGMEMLSKAIELRHNYDDAMAYMNLMYRERADIECGNPSANASDLKTADHWVDLTLSTKKTKAAQAVQKSGE
jgi:tetratricopeptide (TPR) repeat protein